MKRKLCSVLLLAIVLVAPQSALAWNETGHQVVARIAWDNMTPAARQNAVALLQAAPSNACLRDLFSNDSRPLGVRQRDFFVRASTWSDIVRTRCTSFHQPSWHFINFFWTGDSGVTAQDVTGIRTPVPNVVERLQTLRPLVTSSLPQAQRSTTLAWILHLVGDIHQPLHTSGRVTTNPDERQGDRGGNLFLVLDRNGHSLPLHSYWDGIIDDVVRRRSGEREQAYVERVALSIMRQHPQSAVRSRLQSGQFDAWAREGFATTKRLVYPSSLRRNRRPSQVYRQTAFDTSEEAIALGGYRLADLLNQLFRS